MPNDAIITMRFIGSGDLAELGSGRFEKDVIPEGNWIYDAVEKDPKTGQDRNVKKVLGVDAARLSHWGETLAAMREAGHNIPFSLDHNTSDSSKNRGFVTRFFSRPTKADPSKMVGVCQLSDVPKPKDGDPGIGTTIKEVSIGVCAEWMDGAGRVWKDFIHHIAPCIRPIVPGQRNFVALKSADETTAKLESQEGEDMDRIKELEAEVARLKGELDAKVAALASAEGSVATLKSKYEPPPVQRTPREIELEAQNATLKAAALDGEIAALKTRQAIPAAQATRLRALLSMPSDGASSGVVCLKSAVTETVKLSEGGKEVEKQVEKIVETRESVADSVRAFLKSLPDGAAFAAAKPNGNPVEPKEETTLAEDDPAAYTAKLKTKVEEVVKLKHVEFGDAMTLLGARAGQIASAEKVSYSEALMKVDVAKL